MIVFGLEPLVLHTDAEIEECISSQTALSTFKQLSKPIPRTDSRKAIQQFMSTTI